MATLRRFGPPAAALVIGLTACGSPQAPEAPPQPVPVAHDVRADIASLAAADGTFGADLLASPELPRTGNIAISPVSVGLVLQMVATGAAGQTGTQLARVLHLPNASAAATAAGDLLRDLATTQQDGHNKLRLANSVWTQDNLAVTPAFADAMKTRFGASANQADFAHQPDQARDRINKTIADQTEGKIPQLFPSGSLDETTRLVLTNAIYLEASWAKEFSPDRTTPAPFHRADGSQVQVPMMHNEPSEKPADELGYADGPGYQAVTLPYAGGRLAFTVLLPTGSATDPLVDLLRTKGLASILGSVKPTPVSLSMPKFTLQCNLDLTGALRRAGMPDAFTDSADFSGITTTERLRIQTVRHDVFVQVDEHGTKAAAAAGGAMQATSMPMTTPVVVDRPFLFVITDTATGAPLFLGRVGDPSAQP